MKVALVSVIVAISSTAQLTQPTESTSNPPAVSVDGQVADLETVLAELQAFEAPRLGLMLAPAPHGELLIIGLRSGSPAERAGLRRGDFIIKIDGQQVPPLDKLKAAIRSEPQRESAKLLVWRGGTQTEREVLFAPADGSSASKGRPWAGIQCDEVPGKGLVIKSVYPGGPADKAGLRAGDIIVSADGVKIKSFVDAERYLAQLRAFAVPEVVILRDGKQLTVNVKTISLRETADGLVLETDTQNSASSNQPDQGPESAAAEQERWEAEQHQRLELLLQEIRQDIKDLKANIETPKKDE
jgi:S1-C subfamily serine protease